MTQLEAARKGVITTEMKRVAHRENVLATFIREQVAAGRLRSGHVLTVAEI